jgi:hypothetical protein
MPMRKQLVVRLDARVDKRLRRRAAELGLTLTEYARLMLCFEFPYLLIAADAARIIEAGANEDDPERYTPVLASAKARIEQGEQELRPLVEQLAQGLAARQVASKAELAALERALQAQYQQFRAWVEGLGEMTKLLEGGTI